MHTYENKRNQIDYGSFCSRTYQKDGYLIVYIWHEKPVVANSLSFEQVIRDRFASPSHKKILYTGINLRFTETINFPCAILKPRRSIIQSNIIYKNVYSFTYQLQKATVPNFVNRWSLKLKSFCIRVKVQIQNTNHKGHTV